jgi:DNA-binding transcriptional LysR family regulator
MLDWNDLRTFAEVARRGSMAAAARVFKLHPTTIARRVEAAEESLKSPLFLRSGKTLSLSPMGERLLSTLGPLVDVIDDAARRSVQTEAPIRIAATENGARVLASRALPQLLSKKIEVELLSGNLVVDLTKGEADLALRLIAPEHPSLISKRLASVSYGLYASHGYIKKMPKLEEGFPGQTILLPTRELSSGPEARYLAEHAHAARVGLRASHHVTLAVAAEESCGLAVLPRNVSIFHPKLHLLKKLTDIPGRPIWLVMHKDARKDQRIKQVATEIERVIQEVESTV